MGALLGFNLGLMELALLGVVVIGGAVAVIVWLNVRGGDRED